MRSANQILRAAAVACASAALVLAAPGTAIAASSASGGPSARQITHAVLKSADQKAAFDALSPSQRATFLTAFRHQTSVTVVDRGGRYTPTRAQRARMHTSRAPASLQRLVGSSGKSGCWSRYWEKSWSDLGIHDGDSWMQLNWCGSGGNITSWSQSNVGCAGHHGASCSVSTKAERNVGWEIRSSRYFNANFFGFSNTFCMQIRGGATGLYSERSSNGGTCSLS